MSEAPNTELTPKEAIDAAFRHFRDFYADASLSNVLLEGLDYIEPEHAWEVAIGFDAGRSRRTTQSSLSLAIGGAVQEPIREVRTIVIDAADGRFRRMKADG